MTRNGRKNVAWLCLTALLYVQLAVAAYACPAPPDGTMSPMATAAAAQPCQAMDKESPKLCEQHCVQASQSVDTQPHSAVTPPVLPLIAVVVVPDVGLASKFGIDHALRVKVVDPPPLVRFGVLRI